MELEVGDHQLQVLAETAAAETAELEVSKAAVPIEVAAVAAELLVNLVHPVDLV